jgi:putative holliday junction resolvase
MPVRLVDERLSTVSASAGMRAAGKNTKQQRQSIDQAAAVVILQHALDSERAAGRAPGELLADGGAVANEED